MRRGDQQNAGTEQNNPQGRVAVEGRNPPKGKAGTASSDDKNNEQGPSDWRVIALTAGLVITSFLLFLVGLWQVAITRSTARKQLRAYLNVGEATIINFQTRCPIVQVMVTNFGQTPAYEITALIQVSAVRPANKPLPTLDPENEEAHGVLAPGAHFVLMWRLDDMAPGEAAMPDDRKAQIVAGTAALYAHGRIRYKDVFGKSQWTTYKLAYGGEYGAHPAGNLATCKDGNDAS